MPLIKNGRLVDDLWVTVDNDAPLPESTSVIVPLARWKRNREQLLARNAPLGVRMASNDMAGEIADDVSRLGVIALEFPTFRDGRAYSTARLLRERYGFCGELRAVGDVLRDQLLFMHRCGFDAFEIDDRDAVEAWTRAMAEFSVWYQPATDARPVATALRHPQRTGT